MSRYTLVLSFIFVCLISSLQVQQGIVDSLLLFQTPLEITSPGNRQIWAQAEEMGVALALKDLPTTMLTLPGMGRFTAIKLSAAKTAKVPVKTKISRTPIMLKHQGKCYVFGCANPKTCSLVWYDRNGDGKVQPRRELRCMDRQGNSCQIVVKQAKCK